MTIFLFWVTVTLVFADEEAFTSTIDLNELRGETVLTDDVASEIQQNQEDNDNKISEIQEIDETTENILPAADTKELTTPENSTNTVGNATKNTSVSCKARQIEEDIAVKLVNSSTMLSVVIPESNITANECVLVLFYAPWCHFSAAAAPHFNALARLFPSVHFLGLNAIKYHSLNTRYGTVAVPTILLFHNGRPITKYNETTYTLDKFVKFVAKYTDLLPVGAVNVTSADFMGPLPSEPSKEMDYILCLSWIFIILCCSFAFIKSPLCHYIMESIRSNWLEAEAQHEHGD